MENEKNASFRSNAWTNIPAQYTFLSFSHRRNHKTYQLTILNDKFAAAAVITTPNTNVNIALKYFFCFCLTLSSDVTKQAPISIVDV